MNKSYLNSINNTSLSSKPSTATRLLLMVLFVCLFGSITNAATRTASVTGNWNNTATWGGSSVPTISDDVVIPNGKTVTVTSDAFAKSIVVNNGGTLNVNSPAILTVGTIGTSATTQVVDFQNGSYVNVYTGASMIVYGLLNNSNNSDNVKFDGAVSVDGNVTVGNGSTITGLGSLSSTGTVTGAGTVFGSTNDCTSGNGCNYGCSTNTISANQTVCSGSTATLTGSSGTGYSYQWQSSTTSSSTGFSNISGATSSDYTTSSLTTTTYYRRIVSLSGCSSSNSNVIKVTVSTLISSQSTAAQTRCITVAFSPITVTTTGATGYQWYSNTSNSNSGGTSLGASNGAQTNSYTPQSTVAGTLYYYCVVSGACGTQTSTVSDAFITNANVAISSQSTATQTQCINGTFSPITVTATGTTGYQWYSNAANSNSGGTSLGASNGAQTNSYTPQSTVAGTLYYYCVVSGACGSAVTSAVSGAFITNPATVGGTVSGGTTICSGNTSGTLSLSGQTGTVIKWQSSVSPFSTWTDITNTSTTYTSGTLTATTQFRAVVQSGNCSTANSVVTTVTVSSSNTWTGATNTSWFTPTNWSCGILPTAASDVIIPNVTNKPIIDGTNTTALANTLTVNSGSLTVNIGNTLKVTNAVTNNGGTITFENTASLVQINNVANSGNIKYVRTTNTNVLSTDYTYWSSPVSPQTIGAFSPNTKEGMIYSYDSSIDDWKQEYLSTSMTAGFGYIVRGPEPSGIPGPPSPYTATFVGVPNNGDYSISAIADKSYLLGNPYPSALDADSFLNANSNVLDGTLYFWTHNTATGTNVSNPGTGVYAYSGDDYATYNQTGGTAAAPNTSTVPNGKIGAGQGFFASTKTSISGTAIVYNNSMRVGVGGITGTNSQFFKTKSPKSKQENAIEKNRVWLNLKNSQGAFKQTLVGYVTGATNEYESRFDGESFDGNEFVDFYSVNQDKNLTIQGRALPIDQNDEVPLGYRSTINGDFTISIDQTDGILTNQDVYLEDKLTNTVSNLKSGNYTFNTAAGTFNERFILKYSSKTLGVDTQDKEDGIIVMYSNNYKTLIIRNNSDSVINLVSLFGMTGQKIMDWDLKDNNQTNIQLPIKELSSGIYIVKIKTDKGESGKKIVVN